MRVTFYTEEDAVYIKLNEEPFAYGKASHDNRRYIKYASGGGIIGVEFLVVSEGVDLDDLPEGIRRAIIPVLEQRDVKICA